MGQAVHQSGRNVFKEVSPVAAKHISEHLDSLNLKPQDVKRFWLHQANINMNNMVIKQIFDEDVEEKRYRQFLTGMETQHPQGQLSLFIFIMMT